MRIKSYFAKSVDEAMVQARAELGNDALLLNTRKSEGGKPENYEVVFGTVDAVAPPALPQVRLTQPAKADVPTAVAQTAVAQPVIAQPVIAKAVAARAEKQVAREVVAPERRALK